LAAYISSGIFPGSCGIGEGLIITADRVNTGGLSGKK